ncbi:putative tail length tape measure protein, partial [Clostridium botulinum CFSAN001627]
MATVSTALKMFDQMTKPLQQVTQALNLTISAMDDLNNSANRDVRITNTLNTARGAIQRASAGLQELVNEQDRAQNNQNRLNDSFNRGSSEANGLTSKVKNLVGAYLG